YLSLSPGRIRLTSLIRREESALGRSTRSRKLPRGTLPRHGRTAAAKALPAPKVIRMNEQRIDLIMYTSQCRCSLKFYQQSKDNRHLHKMMHSTWALLSLPAVGRPKARDSRDQSGIACDFPAFGPSSQAAWDDK